MCGISIVVYSSTITSQFSLYVFIVPSLKILPQHFSWTGLL